MSTFVLILLFTNTYGLSSVSVDFTSRTLCEQEGKRVTVGVQDSKYFCLERK